MRAYVETGKVLFAFRYLPLQEKHPAALMAAEAAECSARQGRFWDMNNELFAAPRPLTSESLLAAAQRLGLDPALFGRCMKGETLDTIRRDVAHARGLSITSTPSFLFGAVEGGNQLRVVRHESGAIPPAAFSRILDGLWRRTIDSRSGRMPIKTT
jgi:protein-disulfide isomerase